MTDGSVRGESSRVIVGHSPLQRVSTSLFRHDSIPDKIVRIYDIGRTLQGLVNVSLGLLRIDMIQPACMVRINDISTPSDHQE